MKKVNWILCHSEILRGSITLICSFMYIFLHLLTLNSKNVTVIFSFDVLRFLYTYSCAKLAFLFPIERVFFFCSFKMKSVVSFLQFNVAILWQEETGLQQTWWCFYCNVMSFLNTHVIRQKQGQQCKPSSFSPVVFSRSHPFNTVERTWLVARILRLKGLLNAT